MNKCLKYEFNHLRPLPVILVALFIILACVAYSYFFSSESFTLSDWRENTEAWIAESESALTGLEGDTLRFEEAYVAELRYHLENNIPYNVKSIVSGMADMFALEPFISLIMIIFTLFVMGADKRYGVYKLLFIRPIKKENVIFSKIICVVIYALALSVFFFLVSMSVSAVFNYENGFVTAWGNGTFWKDELFEMLKQYGALPFQLIIIGFVCLALSTLFNSDILSAGIGFAIITAGTTMSSFPDFLPFVREHTFIGLASTFVSRVLTELNAELALVYLANVLVLIAFIIAGFKLKYKEL